MAGIIELAGESGLTLYAIIRNSAGNVWNGSAFESFNAANWDNYDVPMTEQGSSSYYKATFPATIGAGRYGIVIHKQAGVSPVISDTYYDKGTMYWNGTSEESGPETALASLKLDKLINLTAGATKPTAGSWLDQMMNKNAGQTFDPTTDSLEGVKDSGIGPTAAEIADAIADEVLDTGHAVTNSLAERLKSIDDKLPVGNISGFDPGTQKVNLNNNQTGVTVGTVNALGNQAKADVNNELLDVMTVDTIPELVAGTPPSLPTLAKALRYLYNALINKRTTDKSLTEVRIYDNAGTPLAKATISDNGSVFTKEQFGSP